MSIALALCPDDLQRVRDGLAERHLDYTVIDLGQAPDRPCRRCRQPAQQAILA